MLVDVVITGAPGEGGVWKQYMVLTVSNTRTGAPLEEAESLFIPFRGTFEGTASADGWQPIKGACVRACVRITPYPGLFACLARFSPAATAATPCSPVR